jgi:hypothetical protein
VMGRESLIVVRFAIMLETLFFPSEQEPKRLGSIDGRAEDSVTIARNDFAVIAGAKSPHRIEVDRVLDEPDRAVHE